MNYNLFYARNVFFVAFLPHGSTLANIFVKLFDCSSNFLTFKVNARENFSPVF